MNVSQLIRRAQRIYRTEGLLPAIEKSVRFVPRYVRHSLGIRGLYGSSRYRNLLYWWNSRPYSALAEPFTVVHVDPDEITHVTERGPNPGRFQWQDIGTVRGGDWDRGDQRVAELPVVHALRERFEHGADWEEIEFIQHVIDQAERGMIMSTDEFC